MSRPNDLVAAIASALLLLAASAPAMAWEVDVVDPGATGSYSSLKVDSQGRIHISYFGGSQGHMRYAHFDGLQWAIQTVDANFLTGHHTSLALDTAGNPHIAYRYYSGSLVRFASPGESGWTFSDFEADPDKETDISMALDTSDRPHVSYYDGYFQGEAHDLKVASFNGTTWTIALVDAPGQVGRGSSIALDSAGRPHVSYFDETNVTLKHAHFDGVQWSVSTLDDVEFIAFNFRTAIAVDSQDRVHVVYSTYHYEDPNWFGRLKYAFFDGSTWTISVIEEALPTRDFRIPAITIGLDDEPHVTYLLYYNSEPITGDLKYARREGAEWQIEFVDTGNVPDSDFSNAIDLDPASRPHVSYTKDGVLVQAVSAAAAGVWDPTGPLGPGGSSESSGFVLFPPYPNPCQESATVGFALPRAGPVQLELLDSGGRRVATLARGAHEAGEYAATLSRHPLPGGQRAGRLPRGTYLLHLQAGPFSATNKLVVR